MRSNQAVSFSIVCITLMVAMVFHPAIEGWVKGTDDGANSGSRADIVPGPYRNLKKLVDDLLAVTVNWTDTDEDGLPDSVERIIGTEVDNADSDYDTLNDSYEVSLNINPLEPDSNSDGMADPREVAEVPLDIDGDGIQNAWDRDNDGDGLEDKTDLSPFDATEMYRSYHVEINSTGKPMYVTFQVRPRNPENMKLMLEAIDWPLDDKSRMKDMDDSKEDVFINPVLELRGDELPDQEGVANYGIMIIGDVATIPLFSEWEFGRIVGLRGKMFFPERSQPWSSSFELNMTWRVSGLTDLMVKILKTSDGRYLSIEENGTVMAKSTSITEAQRISWEELEDGSIALKSGDGRYLGIDEEGDLEASSTSMDEQCIFNIKNESGEHYLMDRDSRYLEMRMDGSFKVTSDQSQRAAFAIEENGFRSERTHLVSYPEDFSLASVTAAENHGIDIGLFYGENVSKIIAANLLFSYDYLRNASVSMGDLPSLLNDSGIQLDHIMEEYPHQDLAVTECMSWMVKEALDSLPEDRILPVTTLMEDRSAIIDLPESLTSDGRTLSIDFGDEPVLTSRVLKSTWYHTPDLEPLDTQTIVEVVGSLANNLNDEGMTSLMGLVLFWNTGDIFVLKIGEEDRTDKSVLDVVGEVIDVVLTVAKGGLIVWAIAKDFLFPVVKFIYYFYKIFPLHQTGGEGLTSLKWAFSCFGDVTVWGTLSSVISYLGQIVDLICLVIDLGMAFFTWVSMCAACGWSPLGVSIATSYYFMSIAWISVCFLGNVILTFIATVVGALTIPIVGWIIAGIAALLALILGLSEFIVKLITGKGWSEWIMKWIMDAVSGVRNMVDLDMEFVNTKIDLLDRTGNGLDATDRIEYSHIINTTVERTKDGSSAHVKDSHITPIFLMDLPWDGQNWREYLRTKSGNYSRVLSSDITDDHKYIQYEVGTWIEPGIGMVNMPITTSLLVDYKTYYEEYNYLMLYFKTKNQSGIEDGYIVTHYYDVMPGTIDELATWKYLKHSDSDGDGMNDSDESGTDPMNWDTDGDMLGDGYEINLGYDPTDSDTDRDGLWDKREMFAGLDPSMADTDSDGLTDFQEIEGWIINFTYCGHPFDWHIVSDPGLPDTDGDGLNDTMEYLTLQNPMSSDTNGDGMIDEILDYSTTDVQYVDRVGEASEIPAMADFTLDAKGNIIYVTGSDNTVTKIDPDGGLIWKYTDPLVPFNRVAVGPDGRVYASQYSRICVLNENGTYNTTIGFDEPYGIESMFLDDGGHICILCKSDSFGVYLVRLYRNGTVMETHSFPCSNDPAGGFPVVGWYGAGAVNNKGEIFITDPTRDRILVFDRDYDWILTWDANQFGDVKDIWIDGSDNIYVCGYDGSYDRTMKFDRYRRSIVDWSTDLLETSICSGSEGLVYVGGNNLTGTYLGRIMVFWENVTLHRVHENYTFIDTDGEGLSDVSEEDGWTVTVVRDNSTYSFNVTSEIKLADTDIDGLDDLAEYGLRSDPRSPDTDGDGLQDQSEVEQGTNVTTWDTDMDGLGDPVEMTFWSSPLVNDTDGDGLKDDQEFEQGSDPNENDTDSDGLSDLSEWEMRWNPISPDGDGDFMFDGEERESGCSPNDPDKDKDGIDDGMERLFRTDPLNNDCDSDGLNDGFEIENRIDPNSNDTDNDSMTDPKELEVGYNPRNPDSDSDGILDGNDNDFDITLNKDVILAIDESLTSRAFTSDLSNHTKVKVVTPKKLMENYTDSQFIVIVGRPSAFDGTAGAIVRDVLSDRQDLLHDMLVSDQDRCVVRYGYWTAQQTVILLSQPYPNDYTRVLGILKSVIMTIENGTVIADYLSTCRFFDLRFLDAITEIDSQVAGSLKNNLSMRAEVSLLNDPAPLEPLSNANGLSPDEVSMGKYVRLNITDRNGTEIDSDEIKGVSLRIYYTLDDLDQTGDGDVSDPEDLNESTLIMCGNHNGTWVQLFEADWISETGVDTTDLTIAGKQYAGYVWMMGDHLSTYGIGGKRNTLETFILDVGPIIDQDGVPISGASVSLVFSRTEYKNSTGTDGMTAFVLSEELLGNNVIVSIGKEGYEPIFYTTTITQEGSLESSPPRLERVGSDDDGGMKIIYFLTIIIVLVLLLMVAVILLLRKQKKAPEE